VGQLDSGGRGELRDVDQRRWGFVALVLATVYCSMLFVGGAAPPRVLFGSLAALAGLVLVLRLPLPAWREAPARKRKAAILMLVEAVVITVALTATQRTQRVASDQREGE
jgi:hypothetical protein